MTEIVATGKYFRGSAQKARLVVDVVRGKDAEYALDLLKYMPQKAAGHAYKVLKSAIANAVNNNGLDAGDLYIKEIFANEAPTLRRGRAESKGRYRQILKRNSHIHVTLGLNSEKNSGDTSEKKNGKNTEMEVKAEVQTADKPKPAKKKPATKKVDEKTTKESTKTTKKAKK